MAKCFRNVAPNVNPLAGLHVVGELHDIVKMTSRFVSADVQYRNQPWMPVGNRLETLNAEELAIERSRISKARAQDNLYGAVVASDAARQPNLPIAAFANTPHQFVVGNRGGWRQSASKTFWHAAFCPCRLKQTELIYLARLRPRSPRKIKGRAGAN